MNTPNYSDARETLARLLLSVEEETLAIVLSLPTRRSHAMVMRTFNARIAKVSK